MQRAGNKAEERRQFAPQGVKQKCACETLAKGSTWSLHRVGVRANLLRRIFASKRDEVTWGRGENYIVRSFMVVRSTGNHMFW
jgi:hypothetical protein